MLPLAVGSGWIRLRLHGSSLRLFWSALKQSATFAPIATCRDEYQNLDWRFRKL
jgi:hypothetical protein